MCRSSDFLVTARAKRFRARKKSKKYWFPRIDPDRWSPGRAVIRPSAVQLRLDCDEIFDRCGAANCRYKRGSYN